MSLARVALMTGFLGGGGGGGGRRWYPGHRNGCNHRLAETNDPLGISDTIFEV